MQHNLLEMTHVDREHVILQVCGEAIQMLRASPRRRCTQPQKNLRQVSGAWPLQPPNWRFQVLAV